MGTTVYNVSQRLKGGGGGVREREREREREKEREIQTDRQTD